ncbi:MULTISPECIES: pyrroloquinoline quinone biosynthesis peptide chaperone PqqD [unclassified Amycolatopsis]|uniref:pyrroloquinoline quinone biosynthesis peptide chaperone PqqD n=1 Tax=unclassified Amycolatopsis TaxID=2618356 RepID=UPI00056A9EDD|nr:pyrroloquinoline quinone biosynthesis peptide chaperone PqqD [Amycolatopsis sp. Poz14]MCG3753496.1 pyrroloquinoline quinone biosynthesis peptide chaperone PqqD [Amycolatopsis sp. Poz14]
MDTITTASVPKLRVGVRLTFDHVRGTQVLLFPEGVLVPNSTATAVLELCDGATSVSGIVATLRSRYQGVQESDVLTVLARFGQRRVIEWT